MHKLEESAMSHAPLDNDEVEAFKRLLQKQFGYYQKLRIDILKNESVVSFSIGINSEIFINLSDLLARLPSSTVEVSVQGAQIVMVGKVVDILGVTQYLAENACLQVLHREGFFLGAVPNTANQV